MTHLYTQAHDEKRSSTWQSRGPVLTHTHTHTQTHTHTHTNTHTCTHARTHARMHACTHTHCFLYNSMVSKAELISKGSHSLVPGLMSTFFETV